MSQPFLFEKTHPLGRELSDGVVADRAGGRGSVSGPLPPYPVGTHTAWHSSSLSPQHSLYRYTQCLCSTLGMQRARYPHCTVSVGTATASNIPYTWL